MNAKRFIVLTYHEVGDVPERWTCPPELFRRQLDFLEGYGANFVTMDTLLAWRKGVVELPARPVVLHFDDARAGVYEHVAPLLYERKIPATLYCVSAWSNGEFDEEAEGSGLQILEWDKLRELAATGLFTLGSHGVTHRDLRRLDLEKVWAELRESKRSIEDVIGVKVRHFAAPYNRASMLTRIAAQAAGYKSLAVGGSSYNEKTFSPFRIKRYMVTADYDEEVLGGLFDSTWNL